MTKETIEGMAGAVPFVALPPENGDSHTVVAVWHLMDAPRTEQAMAAALPLAGLNAWRVYFGLPMHGRRELPGGMDEFMELAMSDAVRNVYHAITDKAAAEFPAALAEVRRQLSIADGPVVVAGGSGGGMVALTVLAESGTDIAATVLINPVSQLSALIAANERRFGVTYAWDEGSRAIADRFDFVRRADELAGPVLVVLGENDDVAITEPGTALVKELGDRATLVTIPGMEHALAEEPGIEPAPRTEAATATGAKVTDWLRATLAR